MTTGPAAGDGPPPGAGPHRDPHDVQDEPDVDDPHDADDPDDARHSRDVGDACAVCGARTPARPGGSQLVAGRRVVREIGSCRRCGLQLVRFVGEPWREIRG